jgi:hypothetical protein
MGCNNNLRTCPACTRVHSRTGTCPRLLSHTLARSHTQQLPTRPDIYSHDSYPLAHTVSAGAMPRMHTLTTLRTISWTQGGGGRRMACSAMSTTGKRLGWAGGSVRVRPGGVPDEKPQTLRRVNGKEAEWCQEMEQRGLSGGLRSGDSKSSGRNTYLLLHWHHTGTSSLATESMLMLLGQSRILFQARVWGHGMHTHG